MKNNRFLTTTTLIISIVSCLALTSCADLFQGKVTSTYANNATLANIIRTKDVDQLEAPAEIFVSKAESADSISVSWSAVDGAKSYCIERAIVDPNNPDAVIPPDDSEFSVIKRYNYSTSFTDTSIFGSSTPAYNSVQYTNHYRYYYRVTAENSMTGVEPSLPTSNSVYGTLFEPPATISATAGEFETGIKISWDAVSKATQYEIYRTKNPDGTGFEKLDTVKSNTLSYTNSITNENDKGVDFYFMVKAVNAFGNTTVPSPSDLGYALKSGAPSKVTGIQVATRGTSTTQISLSWNASSGAPAGKDMSYTIYRSSSADSSKQSLATTTSTSYDDTRSIKPGVYYYYYIKPYYTDDDGSVIQGALSSLDGTNTEGFILSPPSNLTCVKSNGSQILSFEPSLGTKEERATYTYKVYVSTDNVNYSVGQSTLTEEANYNADTNRLQIPLTTLEAEAYKYFKVTTVKESLESDYSDAVSPAPYAAENVVVSKAENVGGTNNENGVYPVKITWSKPSEDTPDGYYVFRSDKVDSGYKRITDLPVTSLSYIDANDTSKSCKVYYYKVLSLNSLNQGVNYSNTSFGYGALAPEQYLTEYINTVKFSQSKLTYLNKSSDTDKLNTETITGELTGSLYYNGSANIAGGTATFIMKYTNYSDFRIDYIDPNTGNTAYITTFYLNGNTDSNTNLSGNGKMSGTVTLSNCMYPGSVAYGNIIVTGGKIKGGTYGVTPSGFTTTNVDFSKATW